MPSSKVLSYIYRSEFDRGFFQFLCCLTIPIARLVVSYVEENHNVSTHAACVERRMPRFQNSLGSVVTVMCDSTEIRRTVSFLSLHPYIGVVTGTTISAHFIPSVADFAHKKFLFLTGQAEDIHGEVLLCEIAFFVWNCIGCWARYVENVP